MGLRVRESLLPAMPGPRPPPRPESSGTKHRAVSAGAGPAGSGRFKFSRREESRERDLGRHLAALAAQVAPLPQLLARLLEAAVQYLETVGAGQRGDMERGLGALASTAGELQEAVDSGKLRTGVQIQKVIDMFGEIMEQMKIHDRFVDKVIKDCDDMEEEIRVVREQLEEGRQMLTRELGRAREEEMDDSDEELPLPRVLAPGDQAPPSGFVAGDLAVPCLPALGDCGGEEDWATVDWTVATTTNRRAFKFEIIPVDSNEE